MKKSLAFLALGLAASVSTALASVSLAVSIQEDAFAALTATSTTGLINFDNTAYHDFDVANVTGTGIPHLPNGSTNLNTFDVTSSPLAASHTLTLELTQTGLTGIANPASFLSAFSGTLVGVTSEKMTTYIDTSNAAFGTGTLLSTLTCTASCGNGPGALASGVTTASPFSETEIITAVFAPTATSDRLDSGVDISVATVPEPVSMSLIGGGLALLGLLRLRRK